MWKPHTHVTTKICWTCIIRAFRIEFTCIFSVRKLFSTCGAGDDGLCPFRRNKIQLFQPISQAWHRNDAPKSAFWFGSSTYRLHRYRCFNGTRLLYPTLLKTPAKVSKAFKMVSQFGSLDYTIMVKTADLTVVQQTIIDTLHKEGKPQTLPKKLFTECCIQAC